MDFGVAHGLEDELYLRQAPIPDSKSELSMPI